MMKKIIALLCLGTVLLVTGCGQTGPLYMPEDEPQQPQDQVAQ